MSLNVPASNEMLVAKQAERIDTLTTELRDLADVVRELERRNAEDKAMAEAYRALQQQIINSPFLLTEWERFLSFLKMGADDDYIAEAERQAGRRT